MSSTTAATKLGNWVSRILRWLLGMLLIGIAWKYEDATPLYFLGGAIFITGFFTPKRCTDSSCHTNG